MREILVYGEVEVKSASFVHALIWLDREGEIQDIVGVWELGLHCATQR